MYRLAVGIHLTSCLAPALRRGLTSISLIDQGVSALCLLRRDSLLSRSNSLTTTLNHAGHIPPLISSGTLNPLQRGNSLSDPLIARHTRHQVSPKQSNRVAHIELTGAPDRAAGCFLPTRHGQSPGNWASPPNEVQGQRASTFLRGRLWVPC